MEKGKTFNICSLNYKQTSDPEKYLTIPDLDSCVGIVLIEDFNKLRLRACSWINYYGEVSYETGIAKLPVRIREDAEKRIENIFKVFRNQEKFPKGLEKELEKIREKRDPKKIERYIARLPKRLNEPEKIKAYVFANRTKEEKIKGKRERAKDIGIVNPMFDFILKWISDRGLLPVSDGNLYWKKEGNTDDPILYRIRSKQISVHKGNINVTYENNSGVLLNQNSYRKII